MNKQDILLFKAVKLGDLKQVKKLLTSGADIEAKDGDFCVAADWAKYYGHNEILKFLKDVKHS